LRILKCSFYFACNVRVLFKTFYSFIEILHP
jgi:hypothetical protein